MRKIREKLQKMELREIRTRYNHDNTKKGEILPFEKFQFFSCLNVNFKNKNYRKLSFFRENVVEGIKKKTKNIFRLFVKKFNYTAKITLNVFIE